MSTQPTPKALSSDEFWSEVVNVMTCGKKLRSEHYLDKLTTADLEQLRLALSSSGTFAEQQKLCPPRRGGAREGEPPGVKTLCELAQAMRQVWMLRGLERNRLVTAAAQKRCGALGLDAQLTDAVCQVVGEEALVQAARNQVGDFSVKAAAVLMARQDGKLKAIAEQRKQAETELKREALAQAERRIVILEKKAAAFDQLKAAANSGGITPETLHKIESELKLL